MRKVPVGRVLDRPLVLMHPCGGVMLSPHKSILPSAYIDAARKRIYLCSGDRSKVQRALKARIGKSGRWTFLRGDKEQEAEEDNEVLPYYDPVTGPQDGDTQVYLGDWSCQDVIYTFNCVPLVQTNRPREWVKRAPLTAGSCEPGRGGPCVETWGSLGKTNLYSDAQCTKLARVADVLGWSCLEL